MPRELGGVLRSRLRDARQLGNAELGSAGEQNLRYLNSALLSSAFLVRFLPRGKK
jgi:hypothetical protein